MARSVRPMRHGPAQGVGDHDRDVDPGQLEQSRPERRGPTRPGRPAAAARCPARCCDASTPAAASTSPCRVSTIRVLPAPGDHPHGLGADRLLAVDRARRGPRPSPRPSRSRPRRRRRQRELLAGQRVEQQPGQVVAGGDLAARRPAPRPAATRVICAALGRPAPAPTGPSRPRPRRRSSAAGPPGRRCRPPRPSAPRRRRVLSTSQPSSSRRRRGAVVQRDRGRRRLDADRGEHLVGHAAHRGAADDRRDTDDRRGGGEQRLADARARPGRCRC